MRIGPLNRTLEPLNDISARKKDELEVLSLGWNESLERE